MPSKAPLSLPPRSAAQPSVSISAALQSLQSALGYAFKNQKLLQQALTHRSFGATHYERLEFLGDSVLDLAIAAILYERLGDTAEGDLSVIRTHLVRQDSLYPIALRLGVPNCLRMGQGEAKSGGAQKPSILADVVEALIGAIFLESGYETTHAVVKRLFEPLWADVVLAVQRPSDASTAQAQQGLTRLGKDAKTTLQEWLQAKRMALPTYTVLATTGAAHAQKFEVVARIDEIPLEARGTGASRKSAEQMAASQLLAQLTAPTPAP